MFKVHYGTCIECKQDEQLIVVKKGYCQQCNYKLKQSKKKAAGKKTGKYTYVRQATGEAEMMRMIVENMPDIETHCFVCKTRIPVLSYSNLAHVLSKGKYPLFRLNPENIVILCHRIVADANGFQGCHFSYDMTPHSQLKGEGWEKLFELREQLKEQYKQLED